VSETRKKELKERIPCGGRPGERGIKGPEAALSRSDSMVKVKGHGGLFRS